ncbi:MAG TPA: hypothetical protein VF760_06395, partial [Xanthobacteraceae bacterium]
MAINVTARAVIQVKPGIGDAIWHLPFIRAIAATAPDGQVTFFAPDERGQGFARRGAECGLHGLFSACRIGVAARAASSWFGWLR